MCLCRRLSMRSRYLSSAVGSLMGGMAAALAQARVQVVPVAVCAESGSSSVSGGDRRRRPRHRAGAFARDAGAVDQKPFAQRAREADVRGLRPGAREATRGKAHVRSDFCGDVEEGEIKPVRSR